jgi:hypothetical protein
MNTFIKQLVLLLTPIMVGLGLQASEQPAKRTPTGWAYVEVKNKSKHTLRVWWGGHRTFFDKVNCTRVPNGSSKTFWLHDVEAMNGPLFFQEETPSGDVKTVKIANIDYEVIQSVSKAYFFPINEHRGFLNNKKTIEITAGGMYDFRVRQTWPLKLNIFEGWPWVNTETTTYNPITGAFKPLDELLNK